MEFDQIGKYKILGKLGAGAMGEVYKAHDPILIRDVAIKTLSASLAADSDLRKRFYREAQSAARLNHPNIITVYDFGEEQGKTYMAMELLEGTDLKEVIARRSLRDIPDKLRIFEQICDGLAFAHSKEVVHRDLKPSNIHIQPNGQIKIMDFGLARLGSSEMTRAGTIMGTPHYMSPEQVRGERVDARSDIFSLGAVFYEVLTYHKAFDADTMHSILFQVLEKHPPPARDWAPDLPLALVQMVDKALAKDPDRRFRHAGELREALRNLREALAPGAPGDVTRFREPAPAADSTLSSEATMVNETRREPPTRLGSLEETGVQGALARDLAPADLKAVTPVPGTLSGRTPTHVGGAGRRSLARPWLLFAVIGVGLVMAAVFRPWRGPQERPAAPGRDAAGEKVMQALIGTQLELAGRDLADKDYRGAMAQARRTLTLDPGNAEARNVLARAGAALAELEAAAVEAQQAFAGGDTAQASRALGKVLSIDPTHPVATQLSKSLNNMFRGQAEEAHRSMSRSRAAAARLNADSLPAFVEADGLAREAEVLVKKAEFVTGAQKFLQARDAFDRAARNAERRVAQRPSLAPPGPSAAPSPAPPITAPPVAPTPALPTTAPVEAAAPEEEPAIRQVIADYGSAIERKDVALFKAVNPSLSADEERRLREAFKGIKSQQVNITINSIKIHDRQAIVHLARRDIIDGKQQRPVEQTIRLVKGPSGWEIRGIGQ